MQHHLTVAALAMAVVLAGPAWADSDPVILAAAAAATDSSHEAAPSPTAAFRAAYQNAWALRQTGEYNDAVAVADSALRGITQTLARNPDMSTRREVNDLQARLTGLRDAAHHDLESAAAAKKEGNEADEKVLSAPATEGIEPQVNADVTKWVEFFTGAGRSTFERWLKRSGRYVDLFRSVLQKEGLPPDLVHLVFVESGFNLNARSASAAVGPWQFLSSTGRLFGLTVNNWLDERKDPEKSTVAAARYLKHLYSIFGDWPLALASYNAGEGTVLRAIKAQGTNNYWDLRLPRQTEDYVPQFMAVLAISRDPAKYGFDDVALDDPMAFDEIALKGVVDLRAIARLADCDVDELKDLNPAVLRHAAAGSNGVTTLRVPRGKGEILLHRLQTGSRLPAVDLTLKHRVRRGETLRRIAAQYQVSARQLALSNGIGRKRPLRRGMILTVPVSLQAQASPSLIDASDPRASTDYVPSRSFAPRASMGAQSKADGRMTITVHKGETLASIAARYGVSTSDIRRWNRLKSDRVKRGTRLKIRTSTDSEPAAAVSDSKKKPADADSAAVADNDSPSKKDLEADHASARGSSKTTAHKGSGTRRGRLASASSRGRHAAVVTVHKGETLSTIARRHGVTVAQLRRANRLSSGRVMAGQRLKIPTS